MYLENVKVEDTGLEQGKSYVMYAVSEMAITFKRQIKITSFKVVDYAQYKNIVLIGFVEKGKRRAQGTILKDSMLFLESDVVLSVDSDYDSFKGNGLLNFVTEVPDELRAFIKDKNRFKFANLGIITFCSEKSLHDVNLLFQELADKNHAVVKNIMEKVV